MSQNRGGRLVRHPNSDRPDRPALDRPSLFAGMDNEDSTVDGDTQRVRILSTLESARRPTRGARRGPTKIQGITRKKRGVWQTRVLMGLMILGMLTLLASFVMVLLDGHPGSASAKAESAAGSDATPRKTASASSDNNPLAALIVPPQNAMMPPAQQAAVIETVLSAPVPAPQAASTPAQPAPPVIQPAPLAAKAQPAKASHNPGAPKTAAPTVATTTPASATMAAALPPAPTAQATPTAPPTTRRSTAASRNDADVALLEAMFAHTRAKPATPPKTAASSVSVSDELKKRCGSLIGASAATCRAQVCVQNPTAAACHQDP